MDDVSQEKQDTDVCLLVHTLVALQSFLGVSDIFSHRACKSIIAALSNRDCETSPLGRETSPLGRETSPLGHETSPLGRETSPLGPLGFSSRRMAIYHRLDQLLHHRTQSWTLHARREVQLTRATPGRGWFWFRLANKRYHREYPGAPGSEHLRVDEQTISTGILFTHLKSLVDVIIRRERRIMEGLGANVVSVVY
ncbi:hypothetical protein T484DRAFT_1758273 [Baffinella frigidus]|nr:hypothetical protein T484DRAFT_1758273 [Cryptophyta sp. CCMP2293]